jgi:hypothetical protein
MVGAEAPPNTLVYVYCIVEAGTEAEPLLRTGQLPSLIEGEPLFPIQQAGLVVAASRVPAAGFDEEPLNALLADLSRLAPLAVRHENAIRAVAAAAPSLIPLGFGTVFRDPERVAGFLATQAASLRSILDRLRGRQEWGLKVFCQRDRFNRAVEASSPELRRLDAEAAGAGPGRAYLLRKRREQVARDEQERLGSQILTDLLDQLAVRSEAMRREPLPPDAAATPGPAGQLVLKAAFLVDQEQAPPFPSLVELLASRLSESGFQLELSGPWAPYSFVREVDQ